MKHVCRQPSDMSNIESWAPGCGRSRRQMSRASTPSRQVHEIGQLGDEGSVAHGAVGLDRRGPLLLLEQQQRFTHRRIDRGPIEYSMLAR